MTMLSLSSEHWIKSIHSKLKIISTGADHDLQHSLGHCYNLNWNLNFTPCTFHLSQFTVQHEGVVIQRMAVASWKLLAYWLCSIDVFLFSNYFTTCGRFKLPYLAKAAAATRAALPCPTTVSCLTYLPTWQQANCMKRRTWLTTCGCQCGHLRLGCDMSTETRWPQTLVRAANASNDSSHCSCDAMCSRSKAADSLLWTTALSSVRQPIHFLWTTHCLSSSWHTHTQSAQISLNHKKDQPHYSYCPFCCSKKTKN